MKLQSLSDCWSKFFCWTRQGNALSLWPHQDIFYPANNMCYTVKLYSTQKQRSTNKLHRQRLISDKDCVVNVLVIVSSILVQHSCTEPLQNHCYPYSFYLTFSSKECQILAWVLQLLWRINNPTAFICNMTVIVIKHFHLWLGLDWTCGIPHCRNKTVSISVKMAFLAF